MVATSSQAFLPANGMFAFFPAEEELGNCMLEDMLPQPRSPSPVLQEFSKEERDPVKTHEGWGVMLPCNPPAHYPGKWGDPEPVQAWGWDMYQKQNRRW